MVVGDFGVKYSGKDHAFHLKSVLEDKYTVTTYWEGKLYIGIALKWDYEKYSVQLSIPGYVRAALHSFQHQKKSPQDSPYPWTQPIYGENNQMLLKKETAEKLDGNYQKRPQKIIGKFLYCARSVDPTMLMALNSLAAVQTNPTIKNAKQVT